MSIEKATVILNGVEQSGFRIQSEKGAAYMVVKLAYMTVTDKCVVVQVPKHAARNGVSVRERFYFGSAGVLSAWESAVHRLRHVVGFLLTPHVVKSSFSAYRKAEFIHFGDDCSNISCAVSVTGKRITVICEVDGKSKRIRIPWDSSYTSVYDSPKGAEAMRTLQQWRDVQLVQRLRPKCVPLSAAIPWVANYNFSPTDHGLLEYIRRCRQCR